MKKIEVKKAADCELKDLQLDPGTRKKVECVPVESLIWCARSGRPLSDLTSPPIRLGQKRTKRVVAAVAQAGFLESEREDNYRQFLFEIAVLPRPESNEEYESQPAITDKVMSGIDDYLRLQLPSRRVFVVSSRFGLSGVPFKTFVELAEELGISASSAQYICNKTIIMLKVRFRRERFGKILMGDGA